MYNKLKNLFPLSYRREYSKYDFLAYILVYVLVAVLAGAAIWLATALTGWIPLIGGLLGWALGIVGGLVEIYVICGIILLVLVHFSKK